MTSYALYLAISALLLIGIIICITYIKDEDDFL
jgi:hypothetical protein